MATIPGTEEALVNESPPYNRANFAYIDIPGPFEKGLAAVYYIAPPDYQARATVTVDFNLEQAWPEETDRQQFYYLERETRKLVEIAWSDEVMEAVSSSLQVPVEELHSGKLRLSQPAEAGWHFYATDQNPEHARDLAAWWAMSFTDSVQEKVSGQTRRATNKGKSSMHDHNFTFDFSFLCRHEVRTRGCRFIGTFDFPIPYGFKVTTLPSDVL